jgi:ribulose-phosphate 3-epimerase
MSLSVINLSLNVLTQFHTIAYMLSSPETQIPTVRYSASIMTGDLVNLQATVEELEELGIDALHVDIIDGDFSPSMPMGLDIAKRLRQVTNLPMDAHIMSTKNEYFVQEVLDMGMESVTFHHESTLHVDRLINLIRNSGAKAGVGLNPATSLSVLEYVLPQVDMLCAMLINPGYATFATETQVPYALQKVSRLRTLIDEQGLDVDLQVDGRVSLATIPGLVRAGATNLVLGSTGLFIKGNTLRENKRLLDLAVAEAAQPAELVAS